MADTRMKYVFNKHNAPITAHARDGNGIILFTKVFPPAQTDMTTGRVISTGYTALKEDEYKQLCETSRVFKRYSGALGLLLVQDELPPDAKTPHEALADARRKEREADAKVAALTADITKLKAELHDSEERYKKLQSASTDAEKLKPLQDELAGLRDFREKVTSALKTHSEKLRESANKDKAVRSALNSLLSVLSGFESKKGV